MCVCMCVCVRARAGWRACVHACVCVDLRLETGTLHRGHRRDAGGPEE